MKKYVWLIDKYFVPEPLTSKNRYKIFFDLSNIEVTIFHSNIGEYNQKLDKSNYEDVQPFYKNVKWEKVPSLSFSKKILYFSFSINLFFSCIFRKRPEIIIASCPDPFQAFAGLILAKIKKAKYIVDFRDYWPELLVENHQIKSGHFLDRFFFFITKQLAKHSDAIMCVNLEESKQYLKKRGVLQKRIFERKNIYIDLNEFESSKRLQGKNYLEAVRFYNISKKESKHILLFTGRLNVGKEHSEYIIKLLNNFSNKISLVVLSSDKNMFNILKKTNELQLLYLYELPRKEYLSILHLVDCLVTFITDIGYDFSSNKIMDALALGTPVIVGNFRKEKRDIGLPGVFSFNIKDYKSFEDAIKDAVNLKKDSKSIEYMKQFSLDLYKRQVDSLNKFLENLDKVN